MNPPEWFVKVALSDNWLEQIADPDFDTDDPIMEQWLEWHTKRAATAEAFWAIVDHIRNGDGDTP